MRRSRIARRLRGAEAQGPWAYGWKAALAALVSVIAVGGALARGPHPYGAQEVPQLMLDGQTRPEGCLRCHSGARGLGSSHDPSSIGCSTCHLGDPTALDERSAHTGMTVLAGDLRIAGATCGLPSCHPSEAARVQGSLMAGSPGLLAVNRFVFGERSSPSGSPEDDLRRLDPRAMPSSPAESHVRKLCGSCHLGAQKEKPGDQGFAARGGGCTACHLAAPSNPGSGSGMLHPEVSAAVSEARCEGCHSRSGRLSLSFHGKVEREEGNPEAGGRLPDGRPFSRADADVHAAKGMTCIDCHVERELMGDGHDHLHGDEATQVRCEDCHAPGSAKAVPQDAARVAGVLRESWRKRGMPPLASGPTLSTSQGTPLWRTDLESRTQRLARDGAQIGIPQASAAPYHRLPGHERLSCQACHTVWAPRCPTCHTRFEPDGRQYDHVAGRETGGEWIEEPAPFGAGRPLLALRSDGKAGPFVEGMRLRLSGIPRQVEGTFWAPIDAHTTGRSRPCESCHGKSAAEYYPVQGETTRARARLFDTTSVARILAVGECIGCHDKYEDGIWADFAASIEALRHARRNPSDRGSASRCQARSTPEPLPSSGK